MASYVLARVMRLTVVAAACLRARRERRLGDTPRQRVRGLLDGIAIFTARRERPGSFFKQFLPLNLSCRNFDSWRGRATGVRSVKENFYPMRKPFPLYLPIKTRPDNMSGAGFIFVYLKG